MSCFFTFVKWAGLFVPALLTKISNFLIFLNNSFTSKSFETSHTNISHSLLSLWIVYCTFVKSPKDGGTYLNFEEVDVIAQVGDENDCYEALFTLVKSNRNENHKPLHDIEIVDIN